MTPSPSSDRNAQSKEGWEDFFSASISTVTRHHRPELELTTDAQPAESGYSTTDDEFKDTGTTNSPSSADLHELDQLEGADTLDLSANRKLSSIV